MSLQTIRNSLIFGCKGSVIDGIGRSIPNYSRANSLWIEEIIDNKLTLKSIEAYNPAFRTDDQNIYLEPGGTNKVLYNASFDRAEWVKGSNITVRSNAILNPAGAREADSLQWASGTGNSQVIRTNVPLTAGDTYHISAYVRANTSNFDVNDKIFIFGDTLEAEVGEGDPLPLSDLNNNIGEWVRLEGNFTPTGVSQANKQYLPSIETSANGTYPSFSVSNFSSSTLTLSGSTQVDIPANALIGAQYVISKAGNVEIIYDIVANTAFNNTNNNITITIDTATGDPTVDGVAISDIGIIVNRDTLNLNVGIYVETISSLDIAGIQIEKRDFATSMIFQRGEVYPKSDTRLEYEHSPVKEERNWAMYFNLAAWQGVGAIFDLGSIYLAIDELDNLIFEGLAFAPFDIGDLAEFQLLLEVDNVKLESRLYIDGILIEAISLVNEFESDPDDPFILTSDGIREFKDYLFFRQVIGSSSDIVGQEGQGDVKILFSEESIMPLEAINYGSPALVLPSIEIPPRLREKYITPIITVDYANEQVTTSYDSGQKIIAALLGGTTAINDPENVTIQRIESKNNSATVIGYANALAIALNVDQYIFTLDSVQGIKPGDNLIFRDVSLSGRASVRFPSTPIDLQIIQTVDVPTKTVTVAASSSFTLARSIIITDQNQDVGEVLIESINNTTNEMRLNNITNIQPGQVIFQPKYETLISRYNYFVSLLDKIAGVRILNTFSNGIVFSNDNEYVVQVTPKIRIFL